MKLCGRRVVEVLGDKGRSKMGNFLQGERDRIELVYGDLVSADNPADAHLALTLFPAATAKNP
jgi:hypothetical protein